MSDPNKITPVEELRQLQRDLWQLAQLYVMLKCNILNAAIPIIIVKDGKLAETCYSDSVTACLKQIDDWMQEEIAGFMKQREISHDRK